MNTGSVLAQELARYPDLVEKWRSLEFHGPVKPSNVDKYRVNLFGTTMDDPPRFFLVWFWIDPADTHPRRIAAQAANSILTMDTYLDPRCECKPSPERFIGEHCKFHKERYGMRD